MTRPPALRKIWQASYAGTYGVTPLCMTPQMSTSHAPVLAASGATDWMISMG